MSNVIDEVRQKLELHLEDIAAEERQVHAALAQLGGSTRKTSRQPAGAASERQVIRKPQTIRKRKLAPRGARKAEFLKVVNDAGQDGVTGAEVAKATTMSLASAYNVGRQLTDAGELVKGDDARYRPMLTPAKKESKPKAAKTQATKAKAAKGESKEPAAA